MYIKLDYKVTSSLIVRAFGDAHYTGQIKYDSWKCLHCSAYGEDIMTMAHNGSCDVPDLRRLLWDFINLEEGVYTLDKEIVREQHERQF